VARVGGDEFAVLVQADGAAVENMRDRLHEAVAAHNRQSSEPYTLSFSCGLSSALPGPDFSLGKLIQEADRQMYEAKRLRRGGASRG
jgi:diguanylate cyclase (GGDEF)-like protein